MGTHTETQFGVDEFFSPHSTHKKKLKGKRLALVANTASVNQDLCPTVSLFFQNNLPLSATFGPQHGIHGEQQANMIESNSFVDSQYNIPSFSLYGKQRRLSPEMASSFDVLIYDLQDVGTRVYTFLTTLFYLLEDCARFQKEFLIFDRPNPAGRPIEGSLLNMDYTSFVGIAPMPMRHGFTMGEAALWYKDHKKIDVDLKIIKLNHYQPADYPWPQDRSWVLPSPNIGNKFTAQMYPGTVLLEGTHLSEGRGTVRPLEILGSPTINHALTTTLEKNFPEVLKGFSLLPIAFKPTFDKFTGKHCKGFQIFIDNHFYESEKFRPYRFIAAVLKSLKIMENHKNNLWIDPPYEYEKKHLPIDIISGCDFLRKWVDDPQSEYGDLDKKLKSDEAIWVETQAPYLLYP